MRYENIVNALVSRVAAIQTQYGLTTVYAALYGSQNYGLDDSDSDIDCVIVVRPTLGQMIDNSEINMEVGFGDSGKAKIVDVMSFAKQLAKGSFVNFEALYSDYSIHEQAFKEEFISHRNDIYEAYRWKIQYAVHGGIGNAIKQAEKCRDNYEKYSKKIYEGMRLMDMYGKVNCDYLPDPYISGLVTRIEFANIKAGRCSDDVLAGYYNTLKEAVEPNLKAEDMPEELKTLDVVRLAKEYMMRHIVNDLPQPDNNDSSET